MIREYPITGLVEGWYFRQREVSANCFVIEGSDIHGRKISKQSAGDLDAVMTECIEFARQINQKEDKLLDAVKSARRDFEAGRCQPATPEQIIRPQ